MIEKISIVHQLAYDLKVGQVMKKEVITISPDRTIIDLRQLLRNYRISGALVVDQDKLVGIISLEDFIKCLSDGEMNALISEKMTSVVKVLYEDELLSKAINEFNKFNYGRFPVLARESGKLVGIVTKGDIVRGLLQKLESEFYEEEVKRFRVSHIFEDIMAHRVSLALQYDITGGDFKKAGEASSALKQTLTRLDIQKPLIRKIVIASYEAEMNMVIFTNKGQMKVIIQPKEIKINFTDQGPGIIDLKQAMQAGFSTAPARIREMGFGAGMGLPNIQKCADQMEISSKVGKGTTIDLIFNIN
ncbi:CBS domain-containing protein [bacterium]|nr:CBS domain-containing protein [bacterium]MBU0899257.1 CBS domain-containing protein [bacterium]MBU1154010.1 CBS domain-containing protein [bacterium]MBU1782644.1 CBS domain-containing protein [bacterium]MBU2599391.1 CBS domain-containing protein [bacterium]